MLVVNKNPKNIHMTKNIKVKGFLTSTQNCTLQFYTIDFSSILKIKNKLFYKTSTGFDDLAIIYIIIDIIIYIFIFI